MKKSNQRGAILGMVLICLLVLTILGYGFLHLSYTNAMQVDKTIQSNQAFWYAEAGVQKAVNNLPILINIANEAFDKGSYSITSNNYVDPVTHVVLDNFWEINSTGYARMSAANTPKRKIRIIIGPNVDGAVNANDDITIGGNASIDGKINAAGDITINGNPTVDGTQNNAIPPFSFSSVFGVDKPYVFSIKDNYYDNRTNNNPLQYDPGDPVNNITWIDGELHITNGTDFNGTGLLVISGDLNVQGVLNFTGIIWVTGDVRITGNPSALYGSLFTEGSIDNLAGTASFNYSFSAIDSAIDALGGGGGGGGGSSSPLTILAWQEIPA